MIHAAPMPRAGAVALWAGEYLAGRMGPDDALERARLGTRFGGSDLFEPIVALHREEHSELRLLLPRPGRIAGLVGPPAAVTAALDAGQALVAVGAEGPLGTIVPAVTVHGAPHSSPLLSTDHVVQVDWTVHPAPSASPGAPVPAPGPARERLMSVMARGAAIVRETGLVPEDFRSPDALPDGWDLVPMPQWWDRQRRDNVDLASTVVLLAEHALTEPELDRAGAIAHGARAARSAVLADLRDAGRDLITAMLSVRA